MALASNDNLTTTQVPTQASNPTKPVNKIVIASLTGPTILAAAAILSYFILSEINTTQNNTNQTTKAADSSEVLLASPKPSISPQTTNNPFNPTTPSSTNPPQASNIGTTVARFFNQASQDVGVATRSIATDHLIRSFSLNLPDPPQDQFYQAWITDPGGQSLVLGSLTKNNFGTFELESRYDYPQFLPLGPSDNFTQATISLETTQDDQIETIVATADLSPSSQTP